MYTILLFFNVYALGQELNSSEKQKSNLETRAIIYYERYEFKKAAVCYEKVLGKKKDNVELMLRLADCYAKLNNTAAAETWYQKAFSLRKTIAHRYELEYALVLISNNKLEKAKKWLTAYENHVKNDIRGKKFLGSIENQDNYYKDSILYLVENFEPVNSPLSDINPIVYNSNLWFVSRQTLSMEAFRNPFYDIMVVGISGNGETSTIKSLSKSVNTKVHEGPIAINSQTKRLYFTRNTPSQNDERRLDLGIFVASLDSQNIFQEKQLTIKGFKHSMGHPTLNNRGDVMYFISDMEAGIGGTDLYKSQKLEENWDTPENLGPIINTPGNEMFPFLYHDSILYFASDGHGGLGGLDILKVNLEDPELAIENLGYPINSNADDFSLFIEDKGKKGYFSSNRSGGKGSDDIYTFEIVRIKVKGLVLDAVKKSFLKGATVTLIGTDGSKSVIKSNENGIFEFSIVPDKDYTLLIRKENYESKELELGTALAHAEKQEMDLNLNLTPETNEVKEIFAGTTYTFSNDTLLAGNDTTERPIYLLSETDYRIDLLEAPANTDSLNIQVTKGELEQTHVESPCRFTVGHTNDGETGTLKEISLSTNEFSFLSDELYRLTIAKMDRKGNITDSVEMLLHPNIQYDFNSHLEKDDYVSLAQEFFRNKNNASKQEIDVPLVFKDLKLGAGEDFTFDLQPVKITGEIGDSAITRIICPDTVYSNRAKDPFLVHMPVDNPLKPISVLTNIDYMEQNYAAPATTFTTDTASFNFNMEVNSDRYYAALNKQRETKEKPVFEEHKIKLDDARFSFRSNCDYKLLIRKTSGNGESLGVVDFDLQRGVQYDFNSGQEKDEFTKAANNLLEKETGKNKEQVSVPLIFKDLQLEEGEGYTLEFKQKGNPEVQGGQTETRIQSAYTNELVRDAAPLLVTLTTAHEDGALTVQTNLELLKGENQDYAPSFALDTNAFNFIMEVDTTNYFAQIKKGQTTPSLIPNGKRDIGYRVQIAASRKPLEAQELKRIYRGEKEIKVFEEDGYYKYYIAEAPTYFEAKQTLNESGVKMCFIAAYINGKRESLKSAMSIQYKEQMLKTGAVITDSIINMVTVNFDFDEYKLRADEEGYLEKLVIHQMKAYNDYYAVVNGHTDIQGSDAYNIGLSQERAEFVKGEMIKKGINGERIKTFSYGESLVLKACDLPNECDESVHKINRRVEIILFKPKSDNNRQATN